MFLFTITYLSPEKVTQARPAHRDYLDKFVQSGHLLLSGPQTNGTGGILIAHFPSLSEAQSFADNDPFTTSGAGHHTITEFNPVKISPEAKSFLDRQPK